MSAPYGFREAPGLEEDEAQQHRVPRAGPMASNGNIYFTDSLLIKGTDILHPMNTGCFSLVASGTYEISYHTIGTNASVLNTPVLVGVHLTANHDVIPGTTSLATVSLEDQKVDLSGTARIMTEDVTYAILAGDAVCRPLKTL